MKYYSNVLDEDRAHALLKSCVVPRPIAWVSTLSGSGMANLAPYSCFTFVATNPPMISLSIGRRSNGAEKDTLVNIRETGELVVNVVPDSLAKAVTITAEEVAQGQSEWDMAPVTPEKSEMVRPPRIAECPVSLECRLAQTVELGESLHTLVIAEVLLFHIQDSMIHNDLVDVVRLRPLARLSGDFFSKLGDVFEVKRER